MNFDNAWFDDVYVIFKDWHAFVKNNMNRQKHIIVFNSMILWFNFCLNHFASPLDILIIY
jgi:hypothetical protein